MRQRLEENKTNCRETTIKHLGRSHELFMINKGLEKFSKNVELKTGLKVPIREDFTAQEWTTLVRKINGNMRRFLYRKLVEMGQPHDEYDYLVVLDFPDLVIKTRFVKAAKVNYIGAFITIPNVHGQNYKENIPFCKEIISYFQEQMKMLE